MQQVIDAITPEQWRLLNVMHVDIKLSTATEIMAGLEIVNRVTAMGSGERDTLQAAFRKGPLFDGDVPSKSARDSLFKDGYIAKVCVCGEWGFNACTYKGGYAYNILQALKVK